MRSKNSAFRICAFLLIMFCMFSCSISNSKSVKFQQYYVQGEQLYTKHCSNCHQQNGSGLGLVYPPLNTSDYMEANFEQVLCLMKYGAKDELTVNGKKFNQPMPGIPALTDLEIAEIATYIYNSWDHNRGIVEVAEASRILSSCKAE
jgi:cytochrome c551